MPKGHGSQEIDERGSQASSSKNPILIIRRRPPQPLLGIPSGFVMHRIRRSPREPHTPIHRVAIGGLPWRVSPRHRSPPPSAPAHPHLLRASIPARCNMDHVVDGNRGDPVVIMRSAVRRQHRRYHIFRFSHVVSRSRSCSKRDRRPADPDLCCLRRCAQAIRPRCRRRMGWG